MKSPFTLNEHLDFRRQISRDRFERFEADFDHMCDTSVGLALLRFFRAEGWISEVERKAARRVFFNQFVVKAGGRK